MQQVKDFIIKNKPYIVYAIVALIAAYLFSAQRKFYVKNTIEVDLQLDSITGDGTQVDTISDTIYTQKDTTINED